MAGNVDPKLAQSLRQAKSTPMFFAFVAKGASDGALLVSKKAIPPKDIKAAKEESGGTAVFKGKCFGEDGMTVFQLKKDPPGTLAKQLKKIIQRDAGLSMQVETRGGAEVEEDDEDKGDEDKGDEDKGDEDKGGEESKSTTASPEAPPEPPKIDVAAFKARYQEIKPLVQQAIEKAPQKKPELDNIANAAAARAKGGDYAGAFEVLAQLEDAAKLALQAKAPPTTPSKGVDAATFKAKYQEIRPLIQEATEKAPKKKPELDNIAAAAAARAKGGDYEGALEVLGQLEEAAKLALKAKAPTGGADAAAFKAKYQEIRPLVQEATEKAPQKKPELDNIANAAAARAKGGDYAGAIEVLDQLEEAAKLALKSGEVPKAPPKPEDPKAPTPEIPKAPPPKPDAKDDRSTEFKDKLKGVRPDFDKALAWAKKDDTDRAEELDGIFAQMYDEAKSKNFDAAIETLDQVRLAVRAALRDMEAKEDEAAKPGIDAKTFKSRLLAVLPTFQDATKKAPDREAELKKLAAEAQKAGNDKDYARALELLDELEAKSRGAIRVAEAKGEIDQGGGPSRVTFAKNRDLYKNARVLAVGELMRLQNAILGDKETQGDERFGEIQSAVNGMAKMLTGLDDRLVEALKKAGKAATPEARTKSAAEALKIVQEYRSAVDKHALLKEMDKNSGYGKFRIYAPLVKSLNTLAEQLKA